MTAPVSWCGSFENTIRQQFFGLIDEELRPREDNIHFPTSVAIGEYGTMIQDLGGPTCATAALVGAAILLSGKLIWASSSPETSRHSRGAGPRLVDLDPMTIMQNALQSFSGDWSLVPPKANTIGPREILGARHRSFWLDGDLGAGVS